MHVATEGTAIRENHIVPDRAIVSNVRIRHEETIVSDGGLAGRSRAAVQRHKLAHHDPVANGQRRRLTGILQILGSTANGRIRVDLAVTADAAAAVDDRMGADARSFTYRDIIFDNRERTDRYSIGERRF
jgi:hypothetical protein